MVLTVQVFNGEAKIFGAVVDVSCHQFLGLLLIAKTDRIANFRMLEIRALVLPSPPNSHPLRHHVTDDHRVLVKEPLHFQKVGVAKKGGM